MLHGEHRKAADHRLDSYQPSHHRQKQRVGGIVHTSCVEVALHFVDLPGLGPTSRFYSNRESRLFWWYRGPNEWNPTGLIIARCLKWSDLHKYLMRTEIAQYRKPLEPRGSGANMYRSPERWANESIEVPGNAITTNPFHFVISHSCFVIALLRGAARPGGNGGPAATKAESKFQAPNSKPAAAGNIYELEP